MTRQPKSNDDVRKGAWGADEDEKLRNYIETHGTGHWRSVGKKAGLQRCGKSCRLRWTNYLRPDIRHGEFSAEEEELIIELHAAHGSRWSMIASQLQGRTDNDIKNHWNTRLKKKLCDMGIDPVTHQPIAVLLRDLAAGTMVRSSRSTSFAGNQVAEEAARRCFRDNMLSKAVRAEFGRSALAVPTFMASLPSRLQESRADANAAERAELVYPVLSHHHQNNARRFERGTNIGSGSRSMDDDSTSTEESLMGRSSSSPTLNSMAELNHVATQQQHRPLNMQHPDYSAAGHSRQLELELAGAGAAAGARQLQAREVIYFPASATQPLRQLTPEGMTTPSSTSNFIPELALCPTSSTTQQLPIPTVMDVEDVSYHHRSPLDCSMLETASASGSSYPAARRKQFEFQADPRHEAQARWFGLRPDSTYDDVNPGHLLLLPSEPANRFSPSLEHEPAHINHGEELVSAPTFLHHHGATGAGSSSSPSAFAVQPNNVMATDGRQLVAAAAAEPFQADQAQESDMGCRSLDALDGPLTASAASSDDVGTQGPYHLNPLLQPVNIANAGPFSSSSAHFPSSNMITSFANSQAGPANSGLQRLPQQYAPRPPPRVALWDFRQDFH